MIVVDVNVLIYVVNAEDDLHKPVYDWWIKALCGHESVALTWPVITGFLRVITNPRVFGQPLSYDEAIGHIQSWLDHPTICVVTETDDHWATLSQLIKKTRMSSKLVADANLAALAITRNAKLASCDSDFARFRQLRWVNPLD